MITELSLKFGRTPEAKPETVQTTPVTVFVGPNNSGKSKILAEINQYCRSGAQNIQDVILDKMTFQSLTPEDAELHLQMVTLTPTLGEPLLPGHIIVGKSHFRQQVHTATLLNILLQPNSNTSLFCQWYLGHNTLKLDGRSRIDLINPKPIGDLQQPPQSSFQELFINDPRRIEVRRIIYEAFGLYFVLDPTSVGQLRIRLSATSPKDSTLERGLHKEAVVFHSQAQPIEQASDGVKAFTGMITEIIAGDPRVLLIDEPEAFLHPSLSFKLGKEIARASSSSEKRLFVSTHSPNFVMGCIQSGAPVTIVRLTYNSGIATARVLKNSDILKFMRNPLLRSTGVLSGLFFEFVVVTEADTDRAFYQEINERLLRFKPEWGIPNCLFINAQNKQTVQTIMRPLRELGIPTVGIVDIDVLKEGGKVWSSLLESASMPPISHQPLSNLRVAVKQKLEDTGRNMKVDGGIELLGVGDKEAANNLFNQLSDYGIFAVRNGELESWLKQLNATGHGPGWLIEVFEKMGEEPDEDSYLKPSEEDVWAFMGQVKQWLVNPTRKGIPV